jgi:hypothetical protein
MLTCPACGRDFTVCHRVRERRVFCSRACAFPNRGGGAIGRFWQQVICQRDTGCWLWTGVLTYGYGALNVHGRRTLAHRFSYELAHGPIPDGIFVCHNCPGGDVKRCVNPAHLWLGSHADNMADASRKGQNAHGERNGAARLTDAQVLDIRQRYVPHQVTKRMLAQEHGVSIGLINRIVTGRIWTHMLKTNVKRKVEARWPPAR